MKYLVLGDYFSSSAVKLRSSHGHKLAIDVGCSLNESPSLARHIIRWPVDEKFRWFSSSVGPSADN